MTTQLLPEGLEHIKLDKAYWKLSEMSEGNNKFRIVQKAIAGWIDWEDQRPMRCRPENKPLPHDPEKPVKAFITCYVWDYAREGLFVLEISQTSVVKAFKAMMENPKLQDYTSYDMNVFKTGSGKTSRYALVPLDPSPIAEHIKEAHVRTPVRLEALYEGGNPWTDLIAIEKKGETTCAVSSTEVASPEFTSIEILAGKVASENLAVAKLQNFVEMLAEKKGKTPEQIVEYSLVTAAFPIFCKAYKKFLES